MSLDITYLLVIWKFRILSCFFFNPILWIDNVAYWPLTEPSCSSCVNRKTEIWGCKQITWIESQKQAMWVDNQKHVGFEKIYMQTPTVVKVSLLVSNQKRFGHSRVLMSAYSGAVATLGKKQKCYVGPRNVNRVVQVLWVLYLPVTISHLQSFNPKKK